VARNTALSKGSLDSACQTLDPSVEASVADGTPSPERELLDRERLSRLRKAVFALSRQQRHCLHLRVEGFRYREIAEIIGVSTSTVGEFLRRAVSRLRKEMYD
jgi:RNA polymerase sigma-70 factor (ECF subfamily)